MAPKVKTGIVIFHRWDSAQGLIEQEIAFDSIDELFARCLEIQSGETVNRVVLDGVDRSGAPRRLTLAFQSATVSEPPIQ
jgi:hypothetical protein